MKQKEVAETETTFTLKERRKLNLLELYCGSGNHTVALAGRHFDFVLGVEIDKRLVKAAAGNLSKNGLNPTQARVVQADSQKFCARVLRRQGGEKPSLVMPKLDPFGRIKSLGNAKTRVRIMVNRNLTRSVRGSTWNSLLFLWIHPGRDSMPQP